MPVLVVLVAIVVIGFLTCGTAIAQQPEQPATGRAIHDLMRGLEIVPLDGQAKPFTLPALDGTRLALGDLAGRPALLYFWASW